MIELLLVIVVSLVLGLGRVLAVRARERGQAAAAVDRARARGVIHGINIGWIHHGRALAKMSGASVHGFAGECAGCRNCYGIVADTREEYWTCSNCGDRNPAPLVAQDVTTPARARIRRS